MSPHDGPRRAASRLAGRIARERALVVALVLVLVAPLVPGSGARAGEAGSEDPATRGREMQRRVYQSLPADDPWLEMSEQQVFGRIWTRPGLSLRDKRLISLTSAAYAASPPGYISHIEGALDNGDLTPAELWEWLIHFTQYAGYPKAAPVWAEIRIALAKRGVLPLPASLGPGRDPELDRERAKPRPQAPPKADPTQKP